MLEGKGDARSALRGMYFWTWNTEEVLAMIEWMRAWNADPAHRRKVKFTGFDMQTATVAQKNVAAYVRRVAPDRADALLAPTTRLGVDDSPRQRAGARQRINDGLAALARDFAAHAPAWRKATGARRSRTRSTTSASSSSGWHDRGWRRRRLRGPRPRDAENVGLAAGARAAGTRMVLWAHNGHVSRGSIAGKNMGAHLRAVSARRTSSPASSFSHGAFQAIDRREGPHGSVEIALDPPPDTRQHRVPATGHERLIADLRRLPAGPVARWFSHPTADAQRGLAVHQRRDHDLPQLLARAYDG